jgi:hypothetical protein
VRICEKSASDGFKLLRRQVTSELTAEHSIVLFCRHDFLLYQLSVIWAKYLFQSVIPSEHGSGNQSGVNLRKPKADWITGQKLSRQWTGATR